MFRKVFISGVGVSAVNPAVQQPPIIATAPPLRSGVQESAQLPSTIVVESTLIHDARNCPKKLFLTLQRRYQRLIPKAAPGADGDTATSHADISRFMDASQTRLSISDRVRIDDGMRFAELCRRRDQFKGLRPVLVKEIDPHNATQRTLEHVIEYKKRLDKVGRAAGILALHRSAFTTMFSPAQSGAAMPLQLHARPAILHYDPSLGAWLVQATSACTDPSSTKQQEMYARLTFEAFVLQQYLQLVISPQSPAASDHARAMLQGVVDPDRSGLYYIRPYMSGPITLFDSDRATAYKATEFMPLSTMARA